VNGEIAGTLRQWDRPHYLALLFAPDEKRDALMALQAFSAEISRIPFQVSEAQVGLIRLQWWRDTLDAIGKGVAQDHPVAKALASAVTRHHLPLLPLQSAIDAHEQDFDPEPPADVVALEEYLGRTGSAFIQLSAMILDRRNAPAVANAAGCAGVAYGMAHIVAEPRQHARLIPPQETLPSLAALARQRLAESRSAPLPSAFLPAFLHAALVDLFLSGPGRLPSPWRMQWQLWRAARRERF
jgi:phytoene synthase